MIQQEESDAHKIKRVIAGIDFWNWGVISMGSIAQMEKLALERSSSIITGSLASRHRFKKVGIW